MSQTDVFNQVLAEANSVFAAEAESVADNYPEPGTYVVLLTRIVRSVRERKRDGSKYASWRFQLRCIEEGEYQGAEFPMYMSSAATWNFGYIKSLVHMATGAECPDDIQKADKLLDQVVGKLLQVKIRANKNRDIPDVFVLEVLGDADEEVKGQDPF